MTDSPNPSSATRTKMWFPGPSGDVLKVKRLSPAEESCDHHMNAVTMVTRVDHTHM